MDGITYRNDAGVDRPQPGPRDPGGHGPAAVRHRGLQARPEDRGLLHRLPEAPVRLAVHRPRLQVALHVLPVAADRRRAPLPRALARPRGRGDRAGRRHFPQVREFFFDDDTFTDNLPRAEAIARELGKLGVTWSCNAKANVPRETLKMLKDNGLRLLLVGYESGNQQILHNIKKGMRIDVARRFTKDCHELGITIHGTFILGLPGETKETIEETIRFATEINPHTIQVSLAAPYPGTFLYKQAVENGWLDADHAELVDEQRRADRAAALSAPVAHGNLRQRRDVLQAVLFPRAEDRLDRRRDGAQPADDEAPAARGRGVLPVPAGAKSCRLIRLEERNNRGTTTASSTPPYETCRRSVGEAPRSVALSPGRSPDGAAPPLASPSPYRPSPYIPPG